MKLRLVAHVYLPCTWRGTLQVSALMYLAGSSRRTARREGARPAVPEAGRVQVGADGSDPLTLRPLGRRQMISGWGASGQQHELPVGASAEAR
jgi:hypothetical protein